MEAIFVYTPILAKTPVFRAVSGLELFGGGGVTPSNAGFRPSGVCEL